MAKISELKEIIVDELFIMYVGNNIIDSKIHFSEEGPTVILFVGVNGVGKTTTIGKLANMLRKKNKKKPNIEGIFRANEKGFGFIEIENQEDWKKIYQENVAAEYHSFSV